MATRIFDRRVAAAATLVLVSAAPACGGGSPAGTPRERGPATEAGAGSGRQAAVTVRDFSFEPGVITVPAGTTVRWTSRDTVLHTVTTGATSGPVNEPDGMLDEPLPAAGATVSFRFDRPGTYPYFCSRHNSMNGRVRVTSGADGMPAERSMHGTNHRGDKR